MKRKAVIALCVIATIILTAGMLLAAGNFTGTWNTAWGPLKMTQTGDKVVGTYGGPYPGKLQGVVKGNRLIYSWMGDHGAGGRGYFVLSADGNSFTGMWGRGNSPKNGGEWNGQRTE